MKKIFIGPQIKSAHNGYRDQMIRIIRIQHTISQLRSHTNRYSNLKLLRQDEPGRQCDPIPMGNKVTYYPKISILKKVLELVQFLVCSKQYLPSRKCSGTQEFGRAGREKQSVHDRYEWERADTENNVIMFVVNQSRTVGGSETLK